MPAGSHFCGAMLDGAVDAHLAAVFEPFRKGTLDVLLFKPADAEFLVSTARFEVFNFVDATAAVALVLWALRRLHRVPTDETTGARNRDPHDQVIATVGTAVAKRPPHIRM